MDSNLYSHYLSDYSERLKQMNEVSHQKADLMSLGTMVHRNCILTTYFISMQNILCKTQDYKKQILELKLLRELIEV